jgi:DNA invertase Pin-like site-specific DNA recombinase
LFIARAFFNTIARLNNFGRLLAAVCDGRVGAILALEASRLARNNRDWHHLIDLCAMPGTLVIDHDGVYNPSLLNDRLLLGLKGTMSEFEISLLRQRAMEALKEKIRRGLVLTQVPVGYIRTEDEGMEKTPDRQIQAAQPVSSGSFVSLVVCARYCFGIEMKNC